MIIVIFNFDGNHLIDQKKGRILIQINSIIKTES